MNKTLTLSVAIIATLGFNANAQKTNDPFHNKAGKLSPRQVYKTPGSNKTTALASRLVSEGTSIFASPSFNVVDSANYIYAASGLRGFYNDLWESWDYDTANYYTFSGAPVVDRRMHNQYNANNMPTLMVGESFDGSAWQIEERNTITYDASGNVATYESEYNNGSGLEKEYKIFTTYNASDKLVSTLEQEWNGTGYVDAYRTTFAYNTGGDIEKEEYEEYDVSAWEMTGRSTYTYDGNGNETEYLSEDFDGSVWTPSYRNIQVFNANNDMTDAYGEQYTGSSWLRTNESYFTYDANHNTITSEYRNYNGTTIVPSNYSDMTYNTYNQILTQKSQSWNPNTSQFEVRLGDPEIRWHYEEFAVSVKDVAKQQTGSMNVFPVPAANFVNIKLNLAKPLGVFGVIQDATGKVVKTWSDAAGKQYIKQLNTDNLVPGNYIIKVMAGGEQYQQKVNIVR